MDNHLIRWNTARIINTHCKQLEFFKGYKGIHSDLYDIYSSIMKYKEDNWSNIQSKFRSAHGYSETNFDDWLKYLDKMLEFQLLVAENEDNSEAGIISKRAKEIFGNKDVAEAHCVDIQILNQLDMLIEYSESVKNIFNFIVPLYNPNFSDITIELEQEIREILQAKGLGDFEVPEELLNNANQTLEEA